MCGICGYISEKKYDEKLLVDMNNSLRHRGPDDSGVYQDLLSNGMQLGLAHRRLSILDLSKAGHQPMFSDDGKIIIVYNGEVYNFQELRVELEKKGYSFRSNCDTEVILYLYEEYGEECLSKLNGMFAIAIFNKEEETLFLARDRMGKKPLYYYYVAEKNIFVFSSELKPIIMFPEFRKEIRTELISAYLVNKCFDSPDTVFMNTFKVEPGQCVTWKKRALIKKKYWDLLERFQTCSAEPILAYEEAKKSLKELLLDSVDKRMIADVTVGTFLSGGVDSTLVTALARELSEEPIRTFTIGFETQKENEAEYAKAVAQYLGTNHTEEYISPRCMLEQIKDLVVYYDEPFSDSSQIPSMLVSKMAKENATVILSGDGGDEFFCGYETYDWLKFGQKLDGLGTVGYRICQLPFIKNMDIIDKMPDKAYAFLINRENATKAQMFQDVRERYTKHMVMGDSISSKRELEKEMLAVEQLKQNWQMRGMLLDMRYYMADEILVKMDRASMKNSLEVRCPILDYRVAEYSFRIPLRYKYYNNQKKFILKDVLYEMVPRELVDRPKKGFGVPLVEWMRSELHAGLMRYADRDILIKQGIFNWEKIHEFIHKMETSDLSVYNSILWGFMVFQMWYQEYVEDLWEI